MHTSYQGGDPADYSQASVGFDYDSVDENISREEESRRLPVSNHNIHQSGTITVPEALIRMIALIIDCHDYQRRIDVIAVAVGLPLIMGRSYTEIAKKHGVTKQAFDKEVLKFQKNFNLPVTRAQKSPQARLSYQKTQLERQARLKLKNQQLKERERNLVWQNS